MLRDYEIIIEALLVEQSSDNLLFSYYFKNKHMDFGGHEGFLPIRNWLKLGSTRRIVSIWTKYFFQILFFTLNLFKRVYAEPIDRFLGVRNNKQFNLVKTGLFRRWSSAFYQVVKISVNYWPAARYTVDVVFSSFRPHFSTYPNLIIRILYILIITDFFKKKNQFPSTS